MKGEMGGAEERVKRQEGARRRYMKGEMGGGTC